MLGKGGFSADCEKRKQERDKEEANTRQAWDDGVKAR